MNYWLCHPSLLLYAKIVVQGHRWPVYDYVIILKNQDQILGNLYVGFVTVSVQNGNFLSFNFIATQTYFNNQFLSFNIKKKINTFHTLKWLQVGV